MSDVCPDCGCRAFGLHGPACKVLASVTAGVTEFDTISEQERRTRELEAIDSSATPDPVNHPDHYQSASGLECIDAIRAALTPEEFRGYCKGAALKYIWREAKKGQNESLAKSGWYLNEAQK